MHELWPRQKRRHHGGRPWKDCGQRSHACRARASIPPCRCVAFGIWRGDFYSALQRFKHEATFTHKERSYCSDCRIDNCMQFRYNQTKQGAEYLHHVRKSQCVPFWEFLWPPLGPRLPGSWDLSPQSKCSSCSSYICRQTVYILSWFLLLRIILLRFSHGFVCISSLSLCIGDWCSIVLKYRALFVHSPPEGHFGCVQFGAILNKSTMDILVQVLFFYKTYTLSLCRYLGTELLRGRSMFIFMWKLNKVITPSSSPSSCIRTELHTIAKIWYHQSFSL